ncbi:MAG TPA: hypothetical protein VN836_04730 [Verrucomicrobiae bacterium]|nr:hypothetical protein [Verrucomicrobiae bacterium]
MRIFLSVLLVLTVANKSPAADTNAPASTKTTASAVLKIGAADADKYYDQVMIVTGKVAQVTIRPTVTFLNFDKPFPNSPFSVVIFHGHSSFYGDANALRGRSVEIRGKIKNYHDKPEIALDNTNQLTVFGPPIPTIAPSATRPTNAPAMSPPTTSPPPATESTNLPEIM